MNTAAAKLSGILPTGNVAVLVNKAEDRRYLSGFRGTAGTLLVCKTGIYLITDGRYGEQAREQAQGWTVIVDKIRYMCLHNLFATRACERFGLMRGLQPMIST